GVGEAVEALAGDAVPAVGLDPQLVLVGQSRKLQPGAVVARDVDLGAVEPGRRDAVGDDVDPRPVGRGGEAHRAHRLEGAATLVGSTRQVEFDTLLVQGDRAGPFGALGMGQVRRGSHGAPVKQTARVCRRVVSAGRSVSSGPPRSWSRTQPARRLSTCRRVRTWCRTYVLTWDVVRRRRVGRD